ncbi:3-hydroxyacyl-[acyl-carrier-protein] dehydratase FabZ [Camellia lanceoleosa]|uniref:3-hydroxyacyl-[acyl-carrier-protein] dehydratase FabZ n=1 Tax=Camellia lanceoleosa TaxID=1840588 RepID=A0ACC0IQK5_9ERIC|nr:3-hydroxyacyl-[acyl-carrier-protein] dehydratase FabZ [Camellia lanceoleosa]
MASTVASHTMSSPLICHSSLPHRTHTASLSRPQSTTALSSQNSASISRSQIVSTPQSKKKKKNCSLFVNNCSAANDNETTTQEVPIELRTHLLLYPLSLSQKYPAFPSVMDINQIREILPHHFPFLLVDRVIEYNPGVSVVAIKNVTINDNFFPGHFPERPIMPGVLMIENECWTRAMAQVGGIVMLQPDVGIPCDNFFFARIDCVRFRKPVVAGYTLVMRMTLVKLQKGFRVAKMEGKAYVGGKLVCEGEFFMAMGS